jgi:U4/U6 small nuclear ribonucleoprotein PRP31
LLSSGDGLGEGYGMLGQAGSGKLRVSAGQSKLAAKVAKKYVIFVLSPV